jgi:hypothetical protein
LSISLGNNQLVVRKKYDGVSARTGFIASAVPEACCVPQVIVNGEFIGNPAGIGV